MARLNIEDSVWKDARVQNFMIKRGSRKLAKADLLETWEIAQRYWVPNRKPVPREELEVLEIDVDSLVACKLLEERDGGFYVKGSEDAFRWLFQRHEAGKKGGRPKKNEPEEPKEEVISDNREKPGETETNRLEPSSSSSSSSSNSKNQEFSYENSSAALGEPSPGGGSVRPQRSPLGAIPEFRGDPDVETLLGGVSQKTQRLWLKLYPDPDWIHRELLQQVDWLERNPLKRPKSPRGSAQFSSGWLQRGWERYRKTLASEPGGPGLNWEGVSLD